jgi:NAD(P)-dependent dehydrogenase (short-subunit alcohol dehydrogenase family)
MPIDQRVGCSVQVASESARLLAVFNPDSAAAKLALLSMSRALAAEFTAQGVRSNIVTPGMTCTPLYERPGGFGDQIAQALGSDREDAIDQVLTAIRPAADAPDRPARRRRRRDRVSHLLGVEQITGAESGKSPCAAACPVLQDDGRGGRPAVPSLLLEHFQERGGER